MLPPSFLLICSGAVRGCWLGFGRGPFGPRHPSDVLFVHLSEHQVRQGVKKEALSGRGGGRWPVTRATFYVEKWSRHCCGRFCSARSGHTRPDAGAQASQCGSAPACVHTRAHTGTQPPPKRPAPLRISSEFIRGKGSACGARAVL